MPERNRTSTRRSSHVTLRVAMRIYEPATNKRFVVKDTHSVMVWLWGGLVALSAAVNVSQKLEVVNRVPGAFAKFLGPRVSPGRSAPTLGQVRLSLAGMQIVWHRRLPANRGRNAATIWSRRVGLGPWLLPRVRELPCPARPPPLQDQFRSSL